jgi:hypothetical protein
MISHVLHHYSARKPNPKNSETHTTVPGNQYTTPKKKKKKKKKQEKKQKESPKHSTTKLKSLQLAS